MKIGEIVKTEFKNLLESGNVSKEKIENLQNLDYCSHTFGSYIPVLKLYIGESEYRYYSPRTTLLFIYGKQYLLSNDWYEDDKRHMLEPLLKWIENHKQKHEKNAMTDSQFKTAFTAVGGWFFLTEYELIKNWSKEKDDLVDLIFKTNSDSEKAGTVTRVNTILRIIENKMDKKALEKVRDSSKIKNEYPDAKELAELLLKKYH